MDPAGESVEGFVSAGLRALRGELGETAYNLTLINLGATNFKKAGGGGGGNASSFFAPPGGAAAVASKADEVTSQAVRLLLMLYGAILTETACGSSGCSGRGDGLATAKRALRVPLQLLPVLQLMVMMMMLATSGSRITLTRAAS